MTDELMNHLTLARQTICSSSSMKDPRWCCIRPQDIDSVVDELARLRRERDEWHEDRDRVLTEQTPWMKMIEAVYPDREMDFGDALALIIKERTEDRRDLAATNGTLDEVAEWSSAFQNENDPGSELNRLDAILSRHKGGA